jgi:hypothetical protein
MPDVLGIKGAKFEVLGAVSGNLSCTPLQRPPALSCTHCKIPFRTSRASCGCLCVLVRNPAQDAPPGRSLFHFDTHILT